MAMIRCKACGKAYDAREGFCPQCGAYNRPPRQEWVDAQGTVHYAEQEKECYERKECHEKKVCYEEQTRRPKPQPRRHPPRKSGASGVVGAVIAAVTIVIMVGNLTHYTAFNFGSLFGGKEELIPDYDWSTPEYVGEAVASAREYAAVGETFYLEDSAFTVEHLEVDWENDTLTVYIAEGDTYQSFPPLVTLREDGLEDWIYPDDVSVAADNGNLFLCTYDLSMLEDAAAGTSLLFSGASEGVDVEVPFDISQW